MRVIGGIYGGRRLKSPPGNRTRPTSDRLRETLFNIIGPRIGSDTRILDLCAGTGAVGIEGLSRGAGFVSFVEKARSNCGLIEQNLDLIGVPENETSVECSDAARFIRQHDSGPWDIIYFDPPYNFDYSAVLSLIAERSSKALTRKGTLIVEHHFKTHLGDEIGPLRRWRIVKQGETALSFYEFD